MKTILLFAALGLAYVIPRASAATDHTGTWQLDIAASDFGGDPPPRSMTLTVFEETSSSLGYRVRRIRSDGSSFSFEWRGTKDGTPSAVRVSGAHNWKASSAYKEVNGDLVEHTIEEDGSLEVGRISLSPDGKTTTADFTWIEFDGKQTKQKWCFRKTK
jgi:hypothetical protein